MALSGRFEWKNNKYVSGKAVFSWTATQNAAANTSTVKWEIYGEHNEDNTVSDSYSLEYFIVKIGSVFSINSNTIHTVSSNYSSATGKYWYYDDKQYSDGSGHYRIQASGTTTIQHNIDGTASFTISSDVKATDNSVYGHFDMSGSHTFTLDTINRASTVNATNGYIGEDISITVSRVSSALTHTLSYTFGRLSGTIAEKSNSTNIKWALPTSFYDEIGNDKSKTGIITCQTYDNNNLVGSSTCEFTASINPAVSAPLLSPAVVDVNSTTIALTGDANTLIRYESMVEFQINAIAQNGATIANQSVTCGSKKVSGSAIGIIDDVESGTFLFSATDSRGLIGEKTITKNIVNYVIPTCYQEIKTELAGVTGAEVSLTIKGNYYNGSFGAVSNSLKIELRHTQNDGTMGEWVELTDGLIPEFSDNTYSLDITISGFGYENVYEFQSRVTDKLNVVQSSMYAVRVLPVFDWSKEDFNFNVPVNISAETLDIHNQTVLRHGESTNNTVLSASGGHIYIRPGGTSDTTGEVRITAQGNIEMTGDIFIGGVNIIAALREKGII